VETERIHIDQTDSKIYSVYSDQVETVDFTDTEFNSMIRDAYNRLSPFKKVLIELGVGKWYIGSYKKPAWNGKLPFYAWKCQDCGKVAFSYPYSHRNILKCQNCAHSPVHRINSATAY
jgi:ribosomal protein S27E